MKKILFQTNLKKKSCIARFLNNLPILGIIIGTLIMTGMQSSLQAQETKYTNPTWRFGVAGGANYNLYRGTTQQLNDKFTTPSAFHDGKGFGLFAAPLIEYHRPTSRWGLMLQAGYDSRNGIFDTKMSPCNYPTDLKTKLDYITIEPSLRFAPFKSNFYLYAGPRFAFNLNNDFTFQMPISYKGEEPGADIEGTFSNTEKFLISMQIGAGYDIPLSSQNSRTKVILSPFVAFHPYFGQDPRSIESWNMTTVRGGVALKFGRGHEVLAPVKVVDFVPIVPQIRFAVNSPVNEPAKARIRETFPLLNYVFFNLGSTQIPDRYILLEKGQVKDFKEDQLEEFAPLKVSGRSNRQMVAYYNVLNILGDRMGKNPSTNITLVGSSESGLQDGMAMAASVKKYMVDIFGINDSRINIESQINPKFPSKKPGGKRELVLLREEDNRVSIESSSPALLMEFQSGQDIRLKPVEIKASEEAPLNSYVSFNVVEGNEVFTKWLLETKDKKGNVQTFGPYTQKEVSLPGKSILGDETEGDYLVTMIGQTKSGMTVKRDTTIHMNLWKAPKYEEGMRFSIIYEFDDSKAINIYEKYLTEIVTPKIPIGGLVQINGYTDIIGDAANNQKLSLKRANDVKKIIESTLSKLGRSDVQFKVNGMGENEDSSQFENEFPEERFYNRTVIIDLLPNE